MERLTLERMLATNDMSEKHIDDICGSLIDNSFDMAKDPITFVIVKAFLENEYGTKTDEMYLDLSYAITQLTRVRDFVKPYCEL